MTEYLKDSVLDPNLDLKGDTLIVLTKNFPFPGVQHGPHAFQVSHDEDFTIHALTFKDGKAVVVEEPILRTRDNTIYYIRRGNLAPNTSQAVEYTLKAGERLDNQVLVAFIDWAYHEFSMGIYNILLTEEPSFDTEVKDESAKVGEGTVGKSKVE